MPMGLGKHGGSRQQYNAWNVGLDFGYSVVGMVLLGLAIDYFAKTSPRALIICAVLGLIGGGYRFIREALAMNRSNNRVGRGGRDGGNGPGRPPPSRPPGG